MTLQPARSASLEEIPVISLLGTAAVDDGQALRAIAQAIGKASREAGFFYIADHGVDVDAIRRIYTEARRFFDQPIDRKEAIHFSRSPHYRGYVPVRSRGRDPNRKGNLLEAFQVMADLPTIADGGSNPLQGPNQWPDALPGFRAAIEDYYATMGRLARVLLRCFAIALELDEDYFIKDFGQPLALLRLSHYPAPEGEITENEIGVSAHRDAGAFTILAQDDNGGLEIQKKDGEWIGARPIAGTFVINIGDVMARWTNDEFSSTLHRVVNYARCDRFSIPYFANLDYDVVASCLPTCCSPENPARYPPMHTGEFLLNHYRAIWPAPGRAA